MKTATKRVPLERVFRRQSNLTPLVIVDFRVCLFAILNQAGNVGVDLSIIPDWAKANWALRLNRGPDMLPLTDYRIIVVDDSYLPDVGYWRHQQKADYKGNRPKTREPLYHQIKDIGLELISQFGLPFYSEPLFEADDWAGLCYRIKRDAVAGSTLAEREMFLSTVDLDWAQLVDDSLRILWANTGPWPSRLKNEAEVREYFYRKNKIRIRHPREVAKLKSIVGDSGDNLKSGDDVALFDLVSEHPEYQISDKLKGRLAADLANPEPNNKKQNVDIALRWLISQNLPICST